ncbi:uncharacterized protein TNCT_690601, partial [Trichonephila clavata]
TSPGKGTSFYEQQLHAHRISQSTESPEIYSLRQCSRRSRNRNSLTDMRFGSHASMRKKLHKSMPPLEKKCEFEKKNDSDSDSNYGFPSKKQES